MALQWQVEVLFLCNNFGMNKQDIFEKLYMDEKTRDIPIKYFHAMKQAVEKALNDDEFQQNKSDTYKNTQEY